MSSPKPERLGPADRAAQAKRFEEEFKKERERSAHQTAAKVERLRALRIAKEQADKEEAAKKAATKAPRRGKS